MNQSTRSHLLACLALLTLILGLTACKQANADPVPTFVPPPTVKPPSGATYTVRVGDILDTVETRGRVVARQEAFLVFPLKGGIKSIDISTGDRVEAGELIAELDSPELELDAVKRRFAISYAELRVSQAKTRLQIYLTEARSDVERAEAGVQYREAAVSSAWAQLSPYEAGILHGESNLARAELQLNLTTLSGDITIDRAERYPGKCEGWCALNLSQDRAKVAAANAVAQAGLELAQSGVYEYQAAYNAALAEVNVPKAELEIARLDLKAAQESLALITSTYQLEVDLAQFVLEEAWALYGISAERLASTRLEAPFTGIIISVEKRPGDEVEAYESIGAIADPTELLVEAMVPEEQIPLVSAGQAVNIRLDAYLDQSFSGSVLQIATDPILWQGKSTYLVTVTFDPEQEVPASIRMGADVIFAGQSRANVLMVPRSAILQKGAAPVVDLVHEDGRVEQITIETGFSTLDWIEVTAGLEEGQQIRIP